MRQYFLLCFSLLWLSSELVAQCGSFSATLNTTDQTCSNACDGAVTPIPTGGTAPYTYMWSDGSTASTRNGLCAGIYTVTITDANSCNYTVSDTVVAPAIITANVGQVAESCTGNDGEASVNPTGGVPPYTYQWSTGATTNQLTGLSQGVYGITITDANGCSRTANINVFNNCGPCLINLSSSVQDASCLAVCDGQATITATNGTAPYSYQWSTGATTATATNLCAGTYRVIVVDANGCADSLQVNVGTNLNISTTVTTVAESCTGSDGEATVVASNGVAPYTFLWSSGSPNATATMLSAGKYYVTITDANGCTALDSAEINLNNTLNVATPVIVEDVSCYGGADAFVFVPNANPNYTYTWDNGELGDTARTLNVGVHFLSVTNNTGACTAVRTVVITQPDSLRANATGASTACMDSSFVATASASGGTYPYSFMWSTGDSTSTLMNQPGGQSYTVTITDDKGCTVVETLTPAAIPLPPTLSYSVLQMPLCNGSNEGAFDLTLVTGTADTIIWSNGLAGEDPTNVFGGNYTVEVLDTNGCRTTMSAFMPQPAPLVINPSFTPASAVDSMTGIVTVTPNGGTAPYQYLWNDAAGSTTSQLENVLAGAYAVTVTDANGCIDSLTIQVTAVQTTTRLAEGTSIKIFPNPTRGMLTFDWHFVDAEKASLNLYNMQGQRLWSQTVTQRDGQKQLNLQDLPNGLYMLQVQTATGQQSYRVQLLR